MKISQFQRRKSQFQMKLSQLLFKTASVSFPFSQIPFVLTYVRFAQCIKLSKSKFSNLGFREQSKCVMCSKRENVLFLILLRAGIPLMLRCVKTFSPKKLFSSNSVNLLPAKLSDFKFCPIKCKSPGMLTNSFPAKFSVRIEVSFSNITLGTALMPVNERSRC